MNDNKGYIKIYRKIMEWEWYTDSNVVRLFLHCLLKANHTDKKWRGKVIKRGSFITSYSKLATELKLSIRQIRVALDKLKMTGELSHVSTPNYSIITVNNYELYQSYDKVDDKQMTSYTSNECQTNDKRMTTTNKLKNDKNEKNRRSKYIPSAPQNDAQEIVTLVTENINPILNSIEIQLIQEWINEHPKELIIEAIKETALNKATSIKYTDAILRSWKYKSIKTLQDLEHHNAKRNSGRKRGSHVSEPEWLENHEQYRKSTQEEEIEVDVNQLKSLLESFQ